MKHQPDHALTLTALSESLAGTVADGQFDWGGRLLKSNGGAQRLAQAEWKPAAECKGKSQLDCKADAPSRDESRA
jgi:hypothetical protein